MAEDPTATDVAETELASEDTYEANIVVEAIQDLSEKTKSPSELVSEQVQDLDQFSFLDAEVLSEESTSRIIQGKITVAVTTTSSYMVEDVAVDKIREYLPEHFQIVNVETPER